MNTAATPPVADRLALILGGLGRAVAARIAGGAMQAVMILLVCRRIRRIEGRILGLLARFREGRLRARAASVVGSHAGRDGSGSAALPRGFAWLLPLVPSEAACYAGQLRSALAEPEMVALLVAAPQARRVLAPLCRMLGIEADVLTPVGVACCAPDLSAEVGAEAPASMEAELDRLARYADPACATGAEIAPLPPAAEAWRRCSV